MAAVPTVGLGGRCNSGYGKNSNFSSSQPRDSKRAGKLIRKKV